MNSLNTHKNRFGIQWLLLFDYRNGLTIEEVSIYEKMPEIKYILIQKDICPVKLC